MKKLAITLIALQCVMSIMTAQSISLTNTFGGNADDTGTGDFLMIGSDNDKNSITIGDRIQLDVSSNNLDGRVRLNINSDYFNAKGYANVRPVSFLNLIAGNDFFWKWTINGAYLNATEDFTNHGKLVDSSGAGIILNHGTDKITYTLGGAVGGISELDVNLGAQIIINNVLSFGVTAQNITNDERSLSAYSSINMVKGLDINVGYTYNPTDTYYISGQQIYGECKNAYMINDQVVPAQDSTQHLVQLSIAYNINKFSLCADVMSGLNNKYYTDGSFEELKSDNVPVYSAVKLSYNVIDNLTVSTQAKYNHWLSTDESYDAFSIYPAVSYSTKVGTFNTGARIFFNAEDGFNGISIPLSWQYKIKFNK